VSSFDTCRGRLTTPRSAWASTAPNSRTGFVERYIKLYDAEATELTAAGARELAAALLSAADVYDGVP
jgi:hypothetical protein